MQSFVTDKDSKFRPDLLHTLRLELRNVVFPPFCFPLSEVFGTEVQQYFEVNRVQRTRKLGRH